MSALRAWTSTPIGSVVLLWAILLAINLPAPWLGLRFEQGSRRVSLEPPGWVIGAVWFVLFLLFGLARWRLGMLDTREAALGMRAIEALVVWCSAYAYYTLGLSALTGVSPLVFGFAGNLLTIAAVLITARVVGAASPRVAWFVVPAAVWTAFATIVVVQQWRAGVR